MNLNWEQDIVTRMLTSSEGYEGVQLALLLRRLEQHPETIPTIAAALEDMGAWFMAESAGLSALLEARKAAKTGVA